MASHVCFIVKGGHQSPLLHGELEARAGQGVLQVSREGLLDGCGVIGFLTDGLKSRPHIVWDLWWSPPVLRCVAFPNPGSLLLGECVSRLVRNNTTSILNNHFGGKFYMLTLPSASTCMCMSWTNRTNIHPCLKPPPAGDTSIIRRLTFAAFARKYTCLLVDRKPSINLRFLWVSRYQLWSLERVKSSECIHQSTWPILEWYIYIPSICSKWLVSNSIL